MNEINASKRMREAAANKAEADKIMQARQLQYVNQPTLLQGMKGSFCWHYDDPLRRAQQFDVPFS